MGIPRVFGKKLWVFEAVYEQIGRVFGIRVLGKVFNGIINMVFVDFFYFLKMFELE